MADIPAVGSPGFISIKIDVIKSAVVAVIIAISVAITVSYCIMLFIPALSFIIFVVNFSLFYGLLFRYVIFHGVYFLSIFGNALSVIIPHIIIGVFILIGETVVSLELRVASIKQYRG